MTNRVVVWGASGKTGRALTAALSARGWAVEGVSRHRPTRPGDARWWRPEQLREALDGAAAAWLIAPNMYSDEEDLARDFVQTAQQAQVPRIGYHSVLNPTDASMAHHLRKGRAEQIFLDGHPDVVVVRPSAYHQNLDLSGDLQVPYDLEQSFRTVDLIDVAAASAALLYDPAPAERIVELIGPEQLTIAEMAATASEVFARPVRAAQVPAPEDAPADLRAMFEAYDARGFLPDSGAGSAGLDQLLGRPATTWEQYLRRIQWHLDRPEQFDRPGGGPEQEENT